MDIDKIFYLSNLAQENGKKYLKKRFFFNNLQSIINKDRIIGIVGPRCVGKTVILKQLLNKYDNSIYISMDTCEYEDNLFEIIVDLNSRFKINHFLLDEVHYYKNFSSLLKKLYDFTNVNIIFTSSVALFFSGLKKDLSRRIKLSYLHPFDFREYLYFLNDLTISPIHLETLMNKNIGKEFMGFEKYFSDYLKGGLREDFAVQILKNNGLEFYYLKSKRGKKRPDYLIKKDDKQFIIEIGGKSKGYQQFKGIDSIKYKKVVFAQNAKKKNILPLYLLGMTEI